MQTILTHLVRELTGLPSKSIKISLRPALAYQSNRLYDVWLNDQHWIAKEFLKPDEFEESPRREFYALQKLVSLDIAPKPIHFVPHTDSHNPIVIYEFMEGDMWDRYSPTAVELKQLADLWLKMNSVTSDVDWISRGQERRLSDVYTRFQSYFERYNEWVSTDFRAGEKTVEICWQVFEGHRKCVVELDGYDPPLQFCRADPRFANVIRRPDGRLGMVDWEDSGLRDPACDIADMTAHPNQEDLVSTVQWEAFLEPYLAAVLKHDPQIKHRIQLYHAIIPVFWLGLLLNAGVNRADSDGFDHWLANGIPAQHRLRRYLARCLAYPDLDISAHLETVRELQFFPE